MTVTFLAGFNANGTPAGSSPFYVAPGCNAQYQDATEANSQITWTQAGTFSNLYTYIENNTGTGTLVFRIAAGNGNETITVGASVTGALTDATHTDAVASGNQIDYKGTSSNGSLAQNVTGAQFTPTTTANVVNKLGANIPFTDSSVSTTYFLPICGQMNNNTTEANVQATNNDTATLSNLYVYISANTASVATVKSRIGGANGNLVASIGSGATGVVQDTTHTDSLVAGNLINYAFNSTVTTTLTINQCAADYINTQEFTQYVASYAGNAAMTTSLTQYQSICGTLIFNNTEANASVPLGFASTFSNLQVFVPTNTLTATSTMVFRIAAGTGNQTVSFTSGTTGLQTDTTHTDAAGSAQAVDYRMVSGGTGTSIKITLMGSMCSIASSISATGSSTGTATAQATAISTAAAVGSVTGVAVASGVMNATCLIVGNAVGQAIASAIGNSTALAVGSVSAAAVCSGIGSQGILTVGNAVGQAGVNGIACIEGNLYTPLGADSGDTYTSNVLEC